jgi:GMP synthase-like glutamine amidotransferase
MIILLQTDAEGPPGLALSVLQDVGVELQVLHVYGPDRLHELSGVAGVIVLGSALGVHDSQEFPFLLKVKESIKEVVASNIPVLGICLGGQLLADVLGGKVHRQHNAEVGCYPISLTDAGSNDPLFLGLPREFVTFQWHDDSFEPPAGAVHLASSSRCRYQAFRWRNSAYGIQFHPEVTRQMLSQWILEEDHYEDLLPAFREIEKAYQDAANILFHNFLRIAQVR